VAYRARAANNSGQANSRSSSQPVDRRTHGGCWTGENWALQTGLAKVFNSSEEAALYLEQHGEKIAASEWPIKKSRQISG